MSFIYISNQSPYSTKYINLKLLIAWNARGRLIYPPLCAIQFFRFPSPQGIPWVKTKIRMQFHGIKNLMLFRPMCKFSKWFSIKMWQFLLYTLLDNWCSVGGDCDVDAIPCDGTVKYGDGGMGNASIEWHIMLKKISAIPEETSGDFQRIIIRRNLLDCWNNFPDFFCSFASCIITMSWVLTKSWHRDKLTVDEATWKNQFHILKPSP